MIRAASAALDLYDNGPTELRAETRAWMVRFARTITRDEPGTPRSSTAARVRDWFDDNESFRSTEGFFSADTPFTVAWGMLGGDAGRVWARTHADTEEASMSDKVIELDDAADEAEAALTVSAPRPLVREQYASQETFNGFEGRRPEWSGVLTLEGVETSDRRLIAEGALTWRDLPITLQDQLLSQPGHDGAVAAGPITNIFRNGQEVRGEGFFDSGEDGENARRRMSEGTKQGVSVDLTEVVLDLPEDDDALLEILLGDGLLVILAARIGAATLVSIPAFEGARLQIVGDVSDVDRGALVASAGALPSDLKLTVTVPIEMVGGLVASGPDDVPAPVEWAPVSVLPEGARPADDEVDGRPGEELADVLLDIDDPEQAIEIGDGHVEMQFYVPTRVRFECGPDGNLFNPVLASPVDGEKLQLAVDKAWAAVEAAEEPVAMFDEAEVRQTLLETGGLSDREIDAAVAHLKGEEEDPALVASGSSPAPNAAWFDRVEYPGPTPATIEEGPGGLLQFHGHIALWGSCHIGFSGRCVDVPRGLDYSSFQGDGVPNEVLTASGEVVKAGPIVMDTVHPNLKLKASDAAAHYADTGSLVAQARLYEDAHGLQVRGWVMPHVTDGELALLRASDLSPDWRPRANANGSRGVVAVLAVPVSGFNLALVASGGADLSADAAGAVLSEVAIVGTNWTPQAVALAQRKAAALQTVGRSVPSDIQALADSTEDPAFTRRKADVLARLAGESCGCGGSCCI